MVFSRSIPFVVALLLGLGVPKAFTLLYLSLTLTVFWALRSPGDELSPLMRWSFLWLIIFGVSYSGFQVGWLVWAPVKSYLAEIVAVVVLPGLGLLAGWMLSRKGQKFCTALLFLYILGALFYSLAALMRSRSPWWNVLETFPHVLHVPWGHPEFLSTRAVEQRAFLSLVLLPTGIVLLPSIRSAMRVLGAVVIVMGCLAAHVSWALQGRIGLAALVLALIPFLWLLPNSKSRLIVGFSSLVAVILAITAGTVCDERLWLIRGFISNLYQSPWGGRLIQFSYADCNPMAINQFGSFKGSSSFTPHNVVLDVYNDAGWIPALCLFFAIVPVFIMIVSGFWRVLGQTGWTWPLALRWGFVSVLFVEWLAQPFLYTDQLLFSVGFVVAGMLLAEFREYFVVDSDNHQTLVD